jgi:16S rRNA A1518/A1519 N6-dimethyltransferase RsmA/KsgA/DIM1 with predicted DNA glycosylase/AP lyase activity
LVKNIGRERFNDLSPKDFFDILHLGFGSKRKQLLGNLAKKYDRDKIARVLESFALSLDIRAEDIDIDKWTAIAKGLGPVG